MHESIFAGMIGILLLFAGFISKKKTGKTDMLSIGMGVIIILLSMHAVPFVTY
ncbi:hypothetical protein [Lactiplantibacillus pentosus]|jgi:hypothetical protein|uniref:hypothetical protein n=1 Tax=Lactiplantibacillus pentosus TaxID=1589 RepID=UPI001330085F|nr:hypothetical protein [Lactiplantibacillus pentosus]MBQ0835009.1 hypothetical protein [Lactiplantibacillus pentosus]MBU7463431.1 hypothetical protein [Lactiplantibacillus pentosus]MBU7491455.1 hypothetical protein [Lactiplantibacillus pentosus]MBU7492893.1 hypothetical protein [Lactiplantibacillus pentosus]MBU7518986.1 hypothetical protein [Lactiplantibacillus pentosus]